MIVIVSSESRMIWFPHQRNIVMINEVYYCMLEISIQFNVPFIRDALKKVRDIRVGSLKNDSLMRNFVIQQPLSAIEVSCQAIQMASKNLDQNIPLMEEDDPVT